MKKIGFVLVSMLLFSCQQPGPSELKHRANAHVYNSYWDVVADAYVPLSLPRDMAGDAVLEGDDLAAQVTAFNAAHTDDQWMLENGDIVPIEDAPPCTMYIVDPATHNIIEWAGNVARIETRDNIASWRFEARGVGGELYVDNIPPAPPTPDPYVYYAIYVVLKADGSIYHEDHCTDWTGWLNRDAYFSDMVYTWNLQNRVDGDIYTIITRALYAPPAL